MGEAPHTLVMDRIDPAANMRRFYVLSIQPSLFGDATLVREWGRIGKPGRRRVEIYEDEAGALAAMAAQLKRRQKRGYVLRS